MSDKKDPRRVDVMAVTRTTPTMAETHPAPGTESFFTQNVEPYLKAAKPFARAAIKKATFGFSDDAASAITGKPLEEIREEGRALHARNQAMTALGETAGDIGREAWVTSAGLPFQAMRGASLGARALQGAYAGGVTSLGDELVDAFRNGGSADPIGRGLRVGSSTLFGAGGAALTQPFTKMLPSGRVATLAERTLTRGEKGTLADEIAKGATKGLTGKSRLDLSEAAQASGDDYLKHTLSPNIERMFAEAGGKGTTRPLRVQEAARKEPGVGFYSQASDAERRAKLAERIALDANQGKALRRGSWSPEVQLRRQEAVAASRANPTLAGTPGFETVPPPTFAGRGGQPTPRHAYETSFWDHAVESLPDPAMKDAMRTVLGRLDPRLDRMVGARRAAESFEPYKGMMNARGYANPTPPSSTISVGVPGAGGMARIGIDPAPGLRQKAWEKGAEKMMDPFEQTLKSRITGRTTVDRIGRRTAPMTAAGVTVGNFLDLLARSQGGFQRQE